MAKRSKKVKRPRYVGSDFRPEMYEMMKQEAARQDRSLSSLLRVMAENYFTIQAIAGTEKLIRGDCDQG